MIFKPSGAEKENEDDEISAAWLRRRAPFYKQSQLTQAVIMRGRGRGVGGEEGRAGEQINNFTA